MTLFTDLLEAIAQNESSDGIFFSLFSSRFPAKRIWQQGDKIAPVVNLSRAEQSREEKSDPKSESRRVLGWLLLRAATLLPLQ